MKTKHLVWKHQKGAGSQGLGNQEHAARQHPDWRKDLGSL